MYFLNLTLLQFLATAGAISAFAVTLYLLDRSRRKLVVSTLRFWEPAELPVAVARRRHIQQPWSLILQLVSMALLLLAIAQLRLGAPAQAGRDYIVILDTSAWMGEHAGKGTLMDMARQRARQYVRALPAGDRVMLVRADSLVTPATAFEPDHKKVEAAIEASQPGATALNLDQALAFARHIQAQEGSRPGEIAYVGAGRVLANEAAAAPPRNLRIIPIHDSPENCGLRKIGVRRSASDPDLWEIYVAAHNYGSSPRVLTLALDFGPMAGSARTPVGSQSLRLAPGADAETSFEFRSSAAGILGVTLLPHDAFARDDAAQLELPAAAHVSVMVYSNQRELLEPVLAAMPHISAVYRKPEEYRPGDKGLVILDRFIPPQPPQGDSIWIDPPAGGSPVPVRTTVSDVSFQDWASDEPLAEGLRAKDFKLDKASVFESAPDDIKVGEVAAGPVILARGGTGGQPKIVVFGFHPSLTGMRYELVTPLLFANLLRWIAPDAFRRAEINGGSVGTVKLAMDEDTTPAAVKVTAENGSPLPYTLRDRTLNFFAGSPGLVRVVAGDREYLYSLTLPQLWDTRWTAPAETRQGIPHFTQVFDRSSDLWPLLALAGGCGLLAEWLLFGGGKRRRIAQLVKLRRVVRPPAEVGR